MQSMNFARAKSLTPGPPPAPLPEGEFLYVSEVLAKEPVGLKPIDEDNWELRYSFHVLGVLNERTKKITPAKGWHGAK